MENAIDVIKDSEWLKQHDAELIDYAIHHLDNSRTSCHEDYIDGIDFSIGILKQLKEQNNG